jgi:hypothetical protein
VVSFHRFFPTKTLYELLHACCMCCQSHPPWLNHSVNAAIMALVITSDYVTKRSCFAPTGIPHLMRHDLNIWNSSALDRGSVDTGWFKSYATRIALWLLKLTYRSLITCLAAPPKIITCSAIISKWLRNYYKRFRILWAPRYLRMWRCRS